MHQGYKKKIPGFMTGVVLAVCAVAAYAQETPEVRFPSFRPEQEAQVPKKLLKKISGIGGYRLSAAYNEAEAASTEDKLARCADRYPGAYACLQRRINLFGAVGDIDAVLDAKKARITTIRITYPLKGEEATTCEAGSKAIMQEVEKYYGGPHMREKNQLSWWGEEGGQMKFSAECTYGRQGKVFVTFTESLGLKRSQ